MAPSLSAIVAAIMQRIGGTLMQICIIRSFYELG
jgi:hypothetical protein